MKKFIGIALWILFIFAFLLSQFDTYLGSWGILCFRFFDGSFWIYV
jgi:hypothetical protein